MKPQKDRRSLKAQLCTGTSGAWLEVTDQDLSLERASFYFSGCEQVEEAFISVNVPGKLLGVCHYADDPSLQCMLLLWLTIQDSRQLCADGAL